MSRGALIVGLGIFLGLIALVYFGYLVRNASALGEILARRSADGASPERLAKRVQIIGTAGCGVAIAAILLAILRIVS